MLKAASYVQVCGLKFDVNDNDNKSAARLFSQILMVSLQTFVFNGNIRRMRNMRIMPNSGEETRENGSKSKTKLTNPFTLQRPLHERPSTVKSDFRKMNFSRIHKEPNRKVMWSRRRSSANVPVALLVTRNALLRAQLGQFPQEDCSDKSS